MKKRLFLSFVLLSGYWLATAQSLSTKTVQLTYNASDFTLTTENGLAYIESNVHELMFDNDTLEPALPHVNIYVLVEGDKAFSSVSFTKAEITFANGVRMAPNDPIFDADEIISERSIPSVDFPHKTYPSDIVEYTGEHIIDRSKVLSFRIYPFRYDVASLNLYLVNSISIRVSLTNESAARGHDIPFSSIPTENVRKLVVNPDDFTASCIDDVSRSIMDQYNCEYLIITNEQQKNQYQLLANWKTQKGVRTSFLTVEYINSTYTGDDLPLKIKSVISAWQFLGNYKLKYVLLGGTTDIIPTRICSPKLNGTVSSIPCDMYYGCMTSMLWDTNGNGLYGELNDHINLSPELIVSRLPTASVFDANWQINRIGQYEVYGGPLESSTWNKKILMSGAKAYNYYTQNGHQYSDVQIISEKMYNTYIAPYWQGTRFRFFDTLNDYPNPNMYTLNSQSLSSEINNGYVFLNMHCHGEVDLWNWGNGQGFSAIDLPLINNPQNTIIMSNACRTNLFTSDDCLGIAFMNGFYPNNLINSAGVIAFVGSAGTNAITGNNLSPTDMYYGNMYKLLFTSPKHRLGEAIKGAKELFLSECTSNNYYRYAQFALNLLGDPEMPVYLSQPQSNNMFSYFIRNDSLIVNPGVPYSTICLMKRDSSGDIDYYEVTHDEAVSRFLIGDEEYTLTITAPGYLPQTMAVSKETIYVQNQTLTSDTEYNGGSVIVGRNVTTTQNQGPVNIAGGTTTIRYNDKVEIKNSFTVQPGAQLKIIKTN